MDSTKVFRVLGMLAFSTLILMIFWYWMPSEGGLLRCYSWPDGCSWPYRTPVGELFALAVEGTPNWDAADELWLYSQAVPFIVAWLLRDCLGSVLKRAIRMFVAKI